MKVKFEEKRFTGKIRKLLDTVIAIVEEYQEQGYRMTLRQLYYQLVSRDIIPNQQSEYNRLSRILADARMAGEVDWEFIEDRIRVPRQQSEFRDIEHLVRVAVDSYRLPRWEGQPNYVEVWVEKDALSGVLLPITKEYHVILLVNRGFTSVTAMYDASQRFKEAEVMGKNCYLIYLGDHDPSGEDMVRDIRNRLTVFGCRVEVKKIALTMEQINEYNPPRNPVKMSDRRASKYVAKHGDGSWELDALRPDVLVNLLKVNLDQLLDRTMYEEVVKREESDKERLQGLVKEKFD